MELRVFSNTLEPLGAIDELNTLIWKIKYFDVGTFSLLAPITDNNSKLLLNGNILVKHDGKQEVTDKSGGIWRRAAEITYVHITTDENGQEQLEAQGYMLSGWLSRRVVTPQLNLTTTEQNIVTTLVRNNCGSGAAARRQFERFTILEQDDLGGSAVEYSNDMYVDLGLEVKGEAQAGKLGYDILVNERERKYGFYLYKGMDLTADNNDGNTPCVFSRDFDNVNEQEYENSSENYKNYAYVRGAADEAGSQPVVEIDGAAATGLALKEVFCDASDIARSYDESGTTITIPLTTYLQMLRTRGKTELAGYIENVCFTSGINTTSNLQFKRDFNIGDRVTCMEKSWGIRLDARITEVQETYQKGAETVEVTFGESMPTLVEKIRKVR